MFNIFLYLNLCGKNCLLKKLVGQNVRQAFIFVGQFLCWVGQCLMSNCYFKHCGDTVAIKINKKFASKKIYRVNDISIFPQEDVNDEV